MFINADTGLRLNRSYYDSSVLKFLDTSTNEIIGILAGRHSQDLVTQQTNSWRAQVEILKREFALLESGHLFFEFQIPRMGKRADVIFLTEQAVFVLEFKVGQTSFHLEDLKQTEGYALDLKNFHSASHDCAIVPVLICDQAASARLTPICDRHSVYRPVCSNGQNLGSLIEMVHSSPQAVCYPPGALVWESSSYKPTPTIVEAAQALYASHSVQDIARHDAGAKNMASTSRKLEAIISRSKKKGRKSICFVTGVPGSGKTLVGLNVATSSPGEENAVFLSGNGPLVEVLREALARDEAKRIQSLSLSEARRKVKSFIQNVHHFRDDALVSTAPPTEHVVVFDEAQRAWDLAHTAKFMITKRGQSNFAQSEPDFLIGVMDRHNDWCVVVTLVGGGQEINTGEIGIPGWINAIRSKYSDWDVYYSDRMDEVIYSGASGHFLSLSNYVCKEPDLHLSASMRSFRAETLSDVVQDLVGGDSLAARSKYEAICDRFDIRVTRNLKAAKAWIRGEVRGTDSSGLIASAGGHRLRPEAISVRSKIDAPVWFLNKSLDIRSCHFLEDAATEFDIQGLELDWCLIAWDADFRYSHGHFEHWEFKGSKWQRRNQPEAQKYLENAYRVLLTRARQGMVIYIPKGDSDDETRSPHFYDSTYDYLLACGILPV